MNVQLKYVAGKFADLSEWNLDSLKPLNELAANMAAEAIELSLTDGEVKFRLPIIWHPSDGSLSKRTPDPLDVYIELPLGEYLDSDGPEYAINFGDMVRHELQMLEDDSFSSGLKLLADALRNLATEIDSSIAKWATR